MARDFSVVLDELRKTLAPKMDGDLQHDLNTLSQIKLTQGVAGIPPMLSEMDPLGHPGYVGLVRDKIGVFVLVAAALEQILTETCEELKIEVPAEIGRLDSVLPYLLGTGDLPKPVAKAVEAVVKAVDKADKAADKAEKATQDKAKG